MVVPPSGHQVPKHSGNTWEYFTKESFFLYIVYTLWMTIKAKSMLDVANMLKLFYCHHGPIDIYDLLNEQACSFTVWMHLLNTQTLVVSC